MVNVYFFKFNNYFNKKLLRKETILEYGDPLAIIENSNFNKNDGVYAEHVVNAQFIKSNPDYVVTVSENGIILERWFVIECRRTRMGQYKVQLYRDLMADFRNEILSGKCFIQKGFVNATDPLIFNNENMGFNQIKTGEYLLENKIKSPWIILYLARKDGESYKTYEVNFADVAIENTPDWEVETLSDYKYYNWVNSEYQYYDRDSFQFFAEYIFPQIAAYDAQRGLLYAWGLTKYGFNGLFPGTGLSKYPTENGFNENFPVFKDTPRLLQEGYDYYGEFYGRYESDYRIEGWLQISNITSRGMHSSAEILKRENGKLIKENSTGKYYRVSISESGKINANLEFNIEPTSQLGRSYTQIYQDNRVETTGKNLKYKLTPPSGYNAIKLQLVEVGSESSKAIKARISYNRSFTLDAPYEVVGAPLFDLEFTNFSESRLTINHRGDIALQAMQAIANAYAGESGGAYDIQIVPYAPIDTTDLKDLDITNISQVGYPDEITLALLFKFGNSSFIGQINKEGIPLRNDVKLSNELDIYRITSPNGVGDFQFSPTKNGNQIEQFNYSCTLIPYSPFIRVAPNFSGLYGGEFNDYRGLICRGDYSLPIVSSAWEQYKLSNKYYQEIFDRQIENIEVNNKYQRIQEGVGLFTGIAQGALNGVGAGGLVGAIVGGVFSAGGGAADMIINENLRQEQLDYKRDMFGYELGTIKARANTLVRTTAFNEGNKYFPYVEYFTCTAKEEQAFKDKIKYNGMNVGVIGTVRDYLNPDEDLTFIQGEMIEIDIKDNYQIASEIAKILRGGYRIG